MHLHIYMYAASLALLPLFLLSLYILVSNTFNSAPCAPQQQESATRGKYPSIIWFARESTFTSKFNTNKLADGW